MPVSASNFETPLCDGFDLRSFATRVAKLIFGLLLSYMSYYNGTRTHLSLNKDAPNYAPPDSWTHSLSLDSERTASSICQDCFVQR